MFDTFEEAESLNSNCAFCDLTKFVIVFVPEQNKYVADRCKDPGCAEHCKGGHTQSIKIDLGGPDAVAIASGW